jgi:hypothetical protein
MLFCSEYRAHHLPRRDYRVEHQGEQRIVDTGLLFLYTRRGVARIVIVIRTMRWLCAIGTIEDRRLQKSLVLSWLLDDALWLFHHKHFQHYKMVLLLMKEILSVG